MKNKTNLFPLLTVAAAAILMIILLFVLRVGVSDNGNLIYTLEDLGIYNVNQADGCYTDMFGLASKTFGNGSSGLIYGIVKAFIPVDSAFFVYIPAVIYMLIFLAGLYLAIKSYLCENRANNIIMCVAALVIMLDGAYIAIFNTPYPQAAFIAFFSLLIGSFASYIKSGKIWYLILLTVSGVLLALTGIYAAITGVMVSLAVLAFVKKPGAFNKAVAVVSALIILVSSIFAFTIENTGDNMIYNRVFGGVLKVAENREQALTDMGINPEFSKYADKDFFTEEAQAFINSEEFKQVKDNATTLKTAKYYITHFDEFTAALKKAQSSISVVKSSYLGDYPASSGKANQQSGFWTLYTSVVKKFIPGVFVAPIILAAFVIFFAITFKNKDKETQFTAYLISAVAVGMVLTLPIAVFNNGFSCLEFYLRTYNYLFDFVVTFAIAGGIRYMWIRQQFLRKEYGVNQ